MCANEKSSQTKFSHGRPAHSPWLVLSDSHACNYSFWSKTKIQQHQQEIVLLCLAAQRNSIVTTSQAPRASLISQQSARVTSSTTINQSTSTVKTVVSTPAVVTSTQAALAVTTSKCKRSVGARVAVLN